MNGQTFRDGLSQIMRPDLKAGETVEWIVRDERGAELERRKFMIDGAGDPRILSANSTLKAA